MTTLRLGCIFLSGFLILISLAACDLFGGSGSSGSPEISTPEPNVFNLSAKTNATASSSFVFTNSGDGNLSFNLSSNQPWLTLSPTSGTVVASESQTVNLTASCATAELGSNTATISLTTNDADEKTKTLTVNLNCSAIGSSNFNIVLKFSGNGFNTERITVFEGAAARWAEIITGDLEAVTNIRFNNNTQEGAPLTANFICGYPANEAENNEIITDVDDIIIFARVAPIDGKNNILAQAGPRAVRANGLPYAGCMEFDSADVPELENAGDFINVILHEMGHVLGIGTLWTHPAINLLESNPAGQNCSNASSFVVPPVFTGDNAKREFSVLGESGDVPVEDQFGRGTQCGHWDEGVFDNELMTGFKEAANVSMPLSRLTVASLEDIGYEVSYASVDSYLLPNCRPSCERLLSPNSFERWETLLFPKAFVNEKGEFILLNP